MRSFLLTRRGAVALVAVALMIVGLTAGSSLAQHSVLDDPSRPDADKARDEGSKPLEVYKWLGITDGMTVGDVVPASGYNTHILARVVGDEGHVVAVFTGEEGKASLDSRFSEAGIDNVKVLLNLDDVPDDSVDAFICIRNVHDMITPSLAEQYGMQPDPILGAVLRALKPGGIFGVVDARTTKEGADAEAHRINEKMMIADLEARGFELVDSSELLAKPIAQRAQRVMRVVGGR
jgi:predicted methyltransferase